MGNVCSKLGLIERQSNPIVNVVMLDFIFYQLWQCRFIYVLDAENQVMLLDQRSHIVVQFASWHVSS